MNKQFNHLDRKDNLIHDNIQVLICSGANNPSISLIPQFLHPNKIQKFIGVDRGAFYLIKAGYQLDLAIGDFDSVDPIELQSIENSTERMIKVDAEKDDTDTELALEYIDHHFPKAEILIFGAVGKETRRIDHLISNLYWVYQPRFKGLINKVKIIDHHCQISWLCPGKHLISAGTNLPDYFSIITMTPVKNLSIMHAKYHLTSCDIDYPRAFVSNEFIDLNTKIEINFSQGLVMVLWIDEE